MSEEEKANEIINLYIGSINGIFEAGEMTGNGIKCALIHVQGIIDELNSHYKTLSHINAVESYKKVKQIIEQKQ